MTRHQDSELGTCHVCKCGALLIGDELASHLCPLKGERMLSGRDVFFATLVGLVISALALVVILWAISPAVNRPTGTPIIESRP